jgi:hypothetical protein
MLSNKELQKVFKNILPKNTTKLETKYLYSGNLFFFIVLFFFLFVATL